MRSIRVMIIEDSPVARALLEQLVSSDPRLTVAGAYSNAEEALGDLAKVAPDVISMDIHLPGMNGLEATRRVMENRPTPIVVVSRSILQKDVALSMEALQSGALSVVDKPLGPNQEGFEAMAADFCRQLAMMSEVKVIRQRFNESRITPPTFATRPRKRPAHLHARVDWPLEGSPLALGIVASTGGPHALEELMRWLTARFPVPVFLVQHITSSFHRGFVDWLDQLSSMPVCVAENDMLAEAGHLYVAPANKDLKLEGLHCRTVPGNPDSAHCPSGDTLLHSMAESFGANAMGVLLTGMGDDGAAGLLSMKQRGAYTIAEHESTTVVNGMPEVARQLDAVCSSVPLYSIGPFIRQLLPSVEEVVS